MVTKILKSEAHTHTHTHTHVDVCRFWGKKANLSTEEINTPDCSSARVASPWPWRGQAVLLWGALWWPLSTMVTVTGGFSPVGALG